MTEEELSGSDKETMPEAELFASDDEAEAHEYARRTCVRTYVRTYAKISDPWSSSERAMNPRCDSASQLANTSTNHQRKHIGIKQRDLNTMGQTQWNMRNHESMSHAQNEVPKWGYVRTFNCPGHVFSINKAVFRVRTYVRTYFVGCLRAASPSHGDNCPAGVCLPCVLRGF